MSSWNDILKSSVDLLEGTFADEVKIILKNGDLVKTQAIDSTEDVIINAQYGEILDYNLCLSFSEFNGFKKESIKYLEYKNKKYSILKEQKKEGFTKFYLRE